MHEVLGKGVNKASVKFGLEGLQVDLAGAAQRELRRWASVLHRQQGTQCGSARAGGEDGLTLNEYSLSRIETKQPVASATEEEIYGALGLAWIPPELRENQGEIEAAETGKLPKLVELNQIRGDLHMHTRESDGRATLEEMAAAARELGYEYVAITDHSKALAMANGMDEKRAVAFAHQVREMDQSGLGLRVFSGIECDIRRDGAMDLEDDALGELDFVIGSVHSYMNLEPAEMTDRLLRALECPHLRVIGHPTGRVLLHRDPFPFDFEAVAAVAARRNVYLEINASPERLDFTASLIRAGQGQRLQVRDFNGRSSSQASGQHALWRAHGSPWMAGAVRYSEHSAR